MTRPKCQNMLRWSGQNANQKVGMDKMPTTEISPDKMPTFGWHYVRLAFCPVGILSTHPWAWKRKYIIWLYWGEIISWLVVGYRACFLKFVSKTMVFTDPEGELTNKDFLGLWHIFKFNAYSFSCQRSKLLSELITPELALFHALDKDLPTL